MICKTAGMVAFLVLGSMVTVGGANDKDLLHKKLVPPEIGFSTPLRASSDYFSLGQSCDHPMEITSTKFTTEDHP